MRTSEPLEQPRAFCRGLKVHNAGNGGNVAVPKEDLGIRERSGFNFGLDFESFGGFVPHLPSLCVIVSVQSQPLKGGAFIGELVQRRRHHSGSLAIPEHARAGHGAHATRCIFSLNVADD